MKTYEITIRLTLVDLRPPQRHQNAADSVHGAMTSKVGEIVAAIGAGSSTAVAFRSMDIVDQDSLPRPA